MWMRPDRRLVMVIAALSVACALIMVLSLQNRELRAAQHALTERAEQPYVGMFVPLAIAPSLDGMSLTLGAPTVGTQILYFFTASCQFCRASIPAIVSLAKRASGIDMIGVGFGPTSELREYARVNGFGFPVVELTDPRARALYRSRDVPMVLVVDGDGRVRYQHIGALSTAHVDEILAAAVIPGQPRN
jgi:peroxiredoxin